MTTFHHTLWIIYLLIFLGGDSVVVRLFWFLCGNEIYTDSFFSKIAIKVLPDKYFTIPYAKLSHKVEKSRGDGALMLGFAVHCSHG